MLRRSRESEKVQTIDATMYFPHLSSGIAAFLIGFFTDMSAASMSIYWATDPFVIYPHPFPFPIAFGLAIPLTLACFVIFILLLIDSQSKLYLSLLAVSLLLGTSVPIGLTSPPSLRTWMSNWNAQWSNTSHAMAFQYEKACCGWSNYRDRAITACPFLSVSGCEKVVLSWITTRYHEIFLTYIFVAVCYGYSLFTLTWAIYKKRIECIWAEIEIPFLSTSLYRG
jgi:hypothetical protein